MMAEMYNLETKAGQIFCGTRTTQGFSATINKVMRLVESHMKMEQVVKGSMVNLDYDSKNSSLT